MTDILERYIKEQPSGIYQYFRWVPKEYAHIDSRKNVKVSLKTRDKGEAYAKAKGVNEAQERRWTVLASGNDNATETEQYLKAVAFAQSRGFTYLRAREIADKGERVEERMDVSIEYKGESVVGETSTPGIAPDPSPRVSEIWKLYEERNRDHLSGMSAGQFKRHRQIRERSIKFLIEVLGDVKLAEIKRADTLRFADWWREKIAREELVTYTGNRSISDIKGMLTVIDNSLQTEFHKPWDRLRLKETNATKMKQRKPFPAEWIADKILAPGALDRLNEDGRLIIYTMVETGMRLGEVCNLRPEDIHLDHDVPHVEVAERTDRVQKTDHSVRRVPLVGVSLWAMRQRPNGFPRYADNEASASAAINKTLKAAGLRPTPAHTAYSLRHSFQDRIENAGASDRMQSDLMGHSFSRPKYGDGAEMERRRAFLEGIRFRPEWIEAKENPAG